MVRTGGRDLFGLRSRQSKGVASEAQGPGRSWDGVGVARVRNLTLISWPESRAASRHSSGHSNLINSLPREARESDWPSVYLNVLFQCAPSESASFRVRSRARAHLLFVAPAGEPGEPAD